MEYTYTIEQRIKVLREGFADMKAGVANLLADIEHAEELLTKIERNEIRPEDYEEWAEENEVFQTYGSYIEIVC